MALTTIDRAIEVAAVAHDGQARKGLGLPYISHPFAVAMMLARAGMDEELIIAGVLHDTVEDTMLTLDEIRRDFGPRVAAIVEGCTEPDKEFSWEERKRHTLAYLPTAPRDVRIVACADKVHNARTIREAFEEMGDDVWRRFKRGRDEQTWYYRGLVEALRPRPGEPLLPFYEDLRDEVSRLFGAAG